MSQVSYGTITITDTTDLTTYIRYAKKVPLTAASDFQETPTTDTHYIAVLSIPSNDNIPAWNSNNWKWSEFIGTDGVSVVGTREIYYLKTNGATVVAPSDGSDISQTSKDVQNQWTKNVPAYVTNGEYWSCIQTHLDASPTWVYGSPVLNQALTDTNYNAYLALSVSQHASEDAQGAISISRATQQHFWFNAENIGSGLNLIEAGAYITDTPIDTFKSGKNGGYLLARSDGLILGKGFNRYMELSGSELKFYKSGTTDSTANIASNVAAKLSSTGLEIAAGSITLGDIDVDNRYPFKVDNEGYLTAREGWIGGIDSYVKLEKDDTTDMHYLDVRLSQLDMLLNGDLYGQENVVDVLDIVSQQAGFIQLWEGEQVWLYYKDGEGTEPYIIHQYTNNDTGEISYYYDENEHLLPYTKSTDETVDTTKQYYTQRATKVVDINADSDPSSLDYYEKSGNIYIPTTDTTVITGKDYYEVEYVEVTSPSGNPKNNNYYEDTPESWQSINSIYFQSSDTEVNSNKTYYIIDNNDYIIVENPTGNPSEQSYYEMLPFIDMAGLSQSLKFTDDSLHNQQKLIVSSANNSEDEKVRVEIDPQYLKFLVESDNNSSLEMNLNYDSILNTNSLTINSGEEQIFSIEDSNDYALSTTTGFKAGPLGMFHYKNGLAIGFM